MTDLIGLDGYLVLDSKCIAKPVKLRALLKIFDWLRQAGSVRATAMLACLASKRIIASLLLYKGKLQADRTSTKFENIPTMNSKFIGRQRGT